MAKSDVAVQGGFLLLVLAGAVAIASAFLRKLTEIFGSGKGETLAETRNSV